MNNRTLLVTFQKNMDVIGLKYIHSYLRKNNIDSHILFVPEYDRKNIVTFGRFLRNFRPRIIGISLMSPEFNIAKEFSVYVKEKFPEIPIVWGGIHPSIAPKDCLNYADYIFVGESEQAYLEFIEAFFKNKPVDNIRNLVYKTGDKIHINEIRPLNNNLDALPFPEHFPKKSSISENGDIVKLNSSLFVKNSRYSGKFYSLTTTRGCPFSCAYCCNSFYNKLYGRPIIRRRSVENIIQELKLAIKNFPDFVYINIQDDNFFTYDIHWMTDFADRFKREIKKRFVCRTNPALLNEEKISVLKKAGLSWIFMGLQSGSPRINKNIYRRFVPNKKFIKATKIINKYNIAGYYDVILDNPYETDQDIIKTIDVILRIPKPFMLQLFSLCFYQGTEIYYRALKENLEFENPLDKNFSVYKQTFLNRLIRLSPFYPVGFIKLMVKNRNSKFAKHLLNLIYYPSILIVEPVVWFRLSYISFDKNILYTLKMAVAFFKTGFNQRILKK